MVTALALLAPMIPSIIQGVELLFAKKDKSGSDKMSTTLATLRTIINNVVVSAVPGQDGNPVTNVTDDALTGAIEATFQQLKSLNMLTAQSSSGNVYILRGTVQSLSI